MHEAKLTYHSHGASLPTGTSSDLCPRSDLTFKVFDGLRIEGVNVHQSLLNGCLIRNCTFRKVRFSRCDLEQVQFQNCRFIGVNFCNVELTSTQIDQCNFDTCNFQSALISDCIWRKCDLENCSFQQAVIQNCQFDKCQLTDNCLRGASIQLNTFRQTGFEHMNLGDCTFLNQIMLGCNYKNIRINAESIGSVFGISEHDLLSFGLVYLGQTVTDVAGTNGLLDSLEKDYERRRWYFMSQMLRLNFKRIPRVVGLDACLTAILWPGSVGAPLKTGDITFFEMVISELFRMNELPTLIALTIPERIRVYRRQSASRTDERRDSLKLLQLASRLEGMFLDKLQQLSTTIEPLVGRDKAATVTLTFIEKPAVDVTNFIRTVGEASGLRICSDTRRLSEKTGSYILIIQTTLATLAGLQIALWLINGCVIQVIELKARLKVIALKRTPKAIRDRVLLADQNIPKWMAIAVQSIFSKLTSDHSKLQQIASDFTPGNIKQIEIRKYVGRGRSRDYAGKSNPHKH